MKKLISCMALLALLGCGAAETSRVSNMGTEERQALLERHLATLTERELGEFILDDDPHPTIKLLPNYREQAIVEYQKRTGIPMDQVRLAAQGRIRVGMDIRAARFAWDCYSRMNESVGSWGRHTQYVCGDGSYIYTRNSNRVSSYST